jgi:23S rRNA (cytosine1962-C5)-methyltransferase
MQAHSVGMFRAKKHISDALQKVYGSDLKAVYDKSSGTAPYKAGLELIDGYLYRCDGFNDDEQVVLENGHKFLVNWTEGQKTGFFLDQRDNRDLVGSLSKGRNVLNLFCYTGGFSIYALAAGASHVDSVDSSKKAMMMVDRNVALNGFDQTKHTSLCCDAIDYLRDVPVGKYDLMIVDPPAFAKHRGSLKNALRAYQRLNAAAISKVAPGGFVFTYSCSQVVDKEAFALAVFSAAAQAGRSVRILDRLNQPCDHSVNIYHPEGEYLKGLLLYVE